MPKSEFFSLLAHKDHSDAIESAALFEEGKADATPAKFT
jgi:hypothetical protein